MGKIRLSEDDIQMINLFEKITGARPIDTIQEGETLYFLLNKEDMGMAIGKGGSNIQKARNRIGRNIHIIEYSEDYRQFVKNIFHPAEIKEARLSKSSREKNMVITADKRNKRQIIGPRGEKIKLARRLLDRYLDLKDIILQTS